MDRARTRVSVADVAVAVTVLLLAAAFPLFSLLSHGGGFVTVSYEGGRDTYSLSEERTVTVNSAGHTLVLRIEDGGAYVESSDCKDGTCMHTGRIERPGSVIVCAPARVTVTVSGEEVLPDDADAVIG